MDAFVYILHCSDDTLYTGYTTDLARRVAEHAAGDGAKYTRGRTPVQLVYAEALSSQGAAMSREYEIKQFTRAQKERLIDGSLQSATTESEVPVDSPPSLPAEWRPLVTQVASLRD
jgi:putative endonuclease